MANATATPPKEQLPDDTLTIPVVPADRAQTQRLAVSVLQGVSDLIAGRSPAAPIIAPTRDEEPLAPWELEAERAATTTATADATAVAPPKYEPQTTGSYAWGGYQNGKLPNDALKAIGQGKHRLAAPAADSFIVMREAAARAGITLKVTDSYRSFDQQVAVRAKKGHLVATANPGSSVHGWGKALDVVVDDAKTLAWLRANGAKFGWVNPGWAQEGGKSYEPWHWEWQGSQPVARPATGKRGAQ